MTHPVIQLDVEKGLKAGELVKRMGQTSYNARRLAMASELYGEMVERNARIFFTLAGAMIPGGMRNVISGMIRDGYIHALITTGANIVHDIIESFGIKHLQGREDEDDVYLRERNLNRIYDVYLPQEGFEKLENFMMEVLESMEGQKSSREFLNGVAEKIRDRHSVIRSAFDMDVPVFCPTLHDSVAGLHVMLHGKKLNIDLFSDIKELLDMMFQKGEKGVVIVGGGVPKNFTLQSMLLGDGFDYAIQITTDSPHFGGLSGATLDEAKSWCKLKEGAKAVTVYCDATIALPLIYARLMDGE